MYCVQLCFLEARQPTDLTRPSGACGVARFAGMTKEERLRSGESLMSHAMVFTGYDKRDGEEFPNKWRVENRYMEVEVTGIGCLRLRVVGRRGEKGSGGGW